MTSPERVAVIEARDVEKIFHLSVYQGSLKAALLTGMKRQIREVHALKGLTTSIYPGEAVALVGRNGSGKSTFLALVGRIYLPTSGTLRVQGRVAPLLELGAGFHPDLTGRENIMLNGVILGLTRAQVAEREADIIEFAELREFVDAPLRTFSSGMQARLGFSVAVHTNAEILLVDEALAVGDEAFQEKCFDKIEAFKRAGKAILFVSHDMTDVERVATRALWLESGRLREDGEPAGIVERYLAEAHRKP